MSKYAFNISGADGAASYMCPDVRGHLLDPAALGFLWSYARPHCRRLGAALATAIPIALLGGVMAWAVKEVVEAFTSGEPRGVIFLWLAVGLAGVVLRSGLEILNRQILILLHARIENAIRLDLYETVHENSLDFHSHIRTGELANLIGNDVQHAAGGVVEIYGALWQRPAVLLCLVGVMLYFNPVLSLLALVLLPLLGICVSRVGRRAADAERHFMENQGQMMGTMVESLTNVRQVKAFGQESGQRETLAAKCEDLIGSIRRAVLLRSLVSPAAETLSGVTITVMAVVAFYQLRAGSTTAGDIAGCLAAALALKKPVKGLSGSVVELQRSFSAIRRIVWARELSRAEDGAHVIEGPVQSLELRDVAFSYDGRKQVVAGLNVTFGRGERVALVGASGSGKTTLLDLVTGFYPAQSGKIAVDGRDLREIDLKSWRRQTGIVSQEPLLFDVSIEDNIRYGSGDADADRVVLAAERAGCGEMLARLPDGINTVVGERGCRLSGGERKRVALARALVRPISVLLLDEVTSELDGETEEAILNVVDSLAGDMLVISVSHRPAILRRCDRALIMENGSATEVEPAEAMARLRGPTPPGRGSEEKSS